ncbi:TOM1-like protein 2 isoform X1 [Frankliniella occidentalis]|uniref:TOM1-like protein 2 isoform X1 n=1 Tax=Frankliniella occidentalis TaxID=133901 RepID=A0A9C6X2F0_FRAOC|nr:TOM1-like protein 2 isoform X1 [Frankliniella occidentalis]
MSFFGVGGGNPFATLVGQRIEQATDASLASENWALNMEICDLINSTDEGPKDAIKAIRKRLQQNAARNYTVVMYTLTVLETCVKNCGKRFHIHVCNKEFVQDLVKLIGPKNDPPTAVQEKVLSLIQSWADAFRNQPDLLGVVQVYSDLKVKGIEFPMTNLDTMAPIHTPQRTQEPEVGEEAAATPALPRPSSPRAHAPSNINAAAPESLQNVQLTPDQLAKLQSELDVVQANMAVLNEMLNELTPREEHPSDLELLTELHSTCHAMQQRLVQLIGKLANDEITAELLRINDLLNNLFLRYSRFQGNRERGDKDQRKEKQVESLIDLDDDPAPQQITSKLASLSVTDSGASAQLSNLTSVSAQQGAHGKREKEDDSEFDMFAQSRNVTYESSKSGGSTYQDNLKPDQVSGSLGVVAASRSQASSSQQEQIIGMHKESDFDEMAEWLGDAPAEESMTSSEFERFLAERAAAAENAGNTSSDATTRAQQRHKKDDDASLFAL